MGYLPPPMLTGKSPSNGQDPPAPGNGRLPWPVAQSETMDLVGALRQALASGAHPPTSILRGVPDLGRVLTRADGVALALRADGVITCRARSGKLAPEIGVPLNVDTGISGECVRTGSIMVCQDTATDPRVNAEACIAMGLRSVVVLPLRGPEGIDGILEAFSANAGAFGDEEVHSLRALAEVAEAAYERERRVAEVPPVVAPPPTPTGSIPRPVDLTKADQETVEELFGVPSRQRRYWILGATALALLLTAGVMWLSWRDPVAETATTQTATQAQKVQADNSNTAPALVVQPKPQPGIATRKPESRTAPPLQNAAQLQPASDRSTLATPAQPVSVSATPSGGPATAGPPPTSSESTSAEPPPAVDVPVSGNPDALKNLSSESAALPTLDVRVSEGVTLSTLLHKVEPIYPTQARVLRLDGAVIMEATVDETGAVREVKVMSGPPLLAEAATKAVRQWRYSPSKLNGKPIVVQKQITMVFKLP